jgi:hypothetical protein
MASASPFLVTKNRSRLPETRSRICPNWARAMIAGKVLVASFFPRAAAAYLLVRMARELLNQCVHSNIAEGPMVSSIKTPRLTTEAQLTSVYYSLFYWK